MNDAMFHDRADKQRCLFNPLEMRDICWGFDTYVHLKIYLERTHDA